MKRKRNQSATAPGVRKVGGEMKGNGTDDAVGTAQRPAPDAQSGTESVRMEAEGALAPDVDAGDETASKSAELDENARPSRRKPRRNAKGQLLPGETANQVGANQYTRRNAMQEALTTLALDVSPESPKDRRAIWSRFIALAKRGDPWAVKEYFARRWPAKSEQENTVTVVLRDYTGRSHEGVRRELSVGPNPELVPEQREILVRAREEDEAMNARSRGPQPELSEEEKLDALEAEIAQEQTSGAGSRCDVPPTREIGNIQRRPETARQQERERLRWGEDEEGEACLEIDL